MALLARYMWLALSTSTHRTLHLCSAEQHFKPTWELLCFCDVVVVKKAMNQTQEPSWRILRSHPWRRARGDAKTGHCPALFQRVKIRAVGEVILEPGGDPLACSATAAARAGRPRQRYLEWHRQRRPTPCKCLARQSGPARMRRRRREPAVPSTRSSMAEVPGGAGNVARRVGTGRRGASSVVGEQLAPPRVVVDRQRPRLGAGR